MFFISKIEAETQLHAIKNFHVDKMNQTLVINRNTKHKSTQINQNKSLDLQNNNKEPNKKLTQEVAYQIWFHQIKLNLR